MQYLRIINSPKILNGKVQLPASKSISNRALIIRALCDTPFIIQNLSDADDTKLLNSLFQSAEKELYVKNAGTAARFLLAYYASKKGSDIILTGSDRMKERPVDELVDALKQLGARIEYMDNDGFLPVHILGKNLAGGKIEISAETSSQFISALLFIAPTLLEGLTIELTGKVVSRPYIQLTLEMLAYFGIKVEWVANVISIPPQTYFPRAFFVESDWSSASYFLALAVLYPGSELEFDNLFENSWQGDSVLNDIMKQFGIQIDIEEKRCFIKSTPSQLAHFQYDFIDYPDLIPTFVCLCCARQIPFHISGSRTLKHKESDRAEVLKAELAKLGYILQLDENTITFDGTQQNFESKVIHLNTYHDHRMAMSFAILACQNSNIHIEDPEVVEKSFPGFWDEVKSIGLEYGIVNV